MGVARVKLSIFLSRQPAGRGTISASGAKSTSLQKHSSFSTSLRINDNAGSWQSREGTRRASSRLEVRAAKAKTHVDRWTRPGTSTSGCAAVSLEERVTAEDVKVKSPHEEANGAVRAGYEVKEATAEQEEVTAELDDPEFAENVAVELDTRLGEETDGFQEMSGGAAVVAETGEGIDSDASESHESDDEDTTQEDGSGDLGKGSLLAMTDIEKDTLALLEWNRVTEQVAQFCDTPMAYQQAVAGGLPLGSSQEESESLLDETESALHLSARLNFEGAADISPVLRRLAKRQKLSRNNLSEDPTRSSRLCSLPDLCAVLSFLDSADSLHRQLGCSEAAESTGSEGGECEEEREATGDEGDAKLAVARGLLEGAAWEECRAVREEIQWCVNPLLRSLKDEASPELTQIRSERRANNAELVGLLHAEAKRLAAQAQSSGGGDQAAGSATKRRGRLCIPVRANMKSLLPGCIVLDTSNTGATLFVEPAAAIPLNNRDAELAGRERDEELHVMAALTDLLSAHSPALRDMVQRVVRLDLACARARHALWCHSVRPSFRHREGAERLVEIQAIRHPILLGTALEEGVSLEYASGPPEIGAVPASLSGAAGDEQGRAPQSQPQSQAQAQTQGKGLLPVPVSILVKSSTKAVVISGPNAGGKTLTLKTLGLAALMAKAGMFLPASGEPQLPWFDNVLADIGDEQSLEQSLSTFSGHIRRIGRILAAVKPGSLVLLDEVGSGTDPSEGAALAMALLRHLTGTLPLGEGEGTPEGLQLSPARLTMTTTHYAQLKALRMADNAFEDACVEFDPVTLKATFRVLWGTAGESNALTVAEAKGFPPLLIERARAHVAAIQQSSPSGQASLSPSLPFDSSASSPSDANDHNGAIDYRDSAAGPSESEGGEAQDGFLNSIVRQMEEQEERALGAAAAKAEAEAAYAEGRKQYEEICLQEAKVKKDAERQARSEAAAATSRIRAVSVNFERKVALEQTGGESPGEGRRFTSAEVEAWEREAHSAVSTLAHPFVVLLRESDEEKSSGATDGSPKWVPKVGDEVLVKKFKGAHGVVVSVKGTACEVKLGRLTMAVKVKDLLQKP